MAPSGITLVRVQGGARTNRALTSRESKMIKIQIQMETQEHDDEDLRDQVVLILDNMLGLIPGEVLITSQVEPDERPLPTKPGWYKDVIVERGGDICHGAVLGENSLWFTPLVIGPGGGYCTHNPCDPDVTVRWDEESA